MKYEDFDKLLVQMVAEEMEVGEKKGIEYTQGDRLDNFKRLGQELKCPHCGVPIGARMALWVYLKKHLDSVLSYIVSGKTHTEPIQGRIMDCRVYFSLLRGIIEEEKEVGHSI